MELIAFFGLLFVVFRKIRLPPIAFVKEATQLEILFLIMIVNGIIVAFGHLLQLRRKVPFHISSNKL